MKKIMITGVRPEATEESIRESFAGVGPVHKVTIVPESDGQSLSVILEMDISDAWAYKITSRVTDFWHDGHMINARLLLH